MTKLSPDEFASLKPAVQYGLYDDALNAVDAARSAQADALTAEEAATLAVSQLKDGHAAELQLAKEQAATDLAAAVALAAATASDTIAKLQTQLAGAKGAYQITVTHLHEAALQAEAAQSDTSPAQWLNDYANDGLAALSRANMGPILSAALAKFGTLSKESRAQLLAAMRYPASFANLPTDDQLNILSDSGLVRFQSLDSGTQNAIIAGLGI